MKKHYYVYRITNKVNGKPYIGSRKYEGDDPYTDSYMGSSIYLNEEMKTIGISNFEKEILGFYDSPEEALNAESEMIESINTLEPRGYNRYIPLKGFCRTNVGVTDEARSNMSYSALNRNRDDKEIGKKIKEAWLNKSDEEKQLIKDKISNAHKGKKHSLAINMSKGRKGRKVSEESKAKMRETIRLKKEQKDINKAINLISESNLSIEQLNLLHKRILVKLHI